MKEIFEYNDVFELRNIIKSLNEKLKIFEDSKRAICELVLKDKEVIYCPKCHSFSINKNGKCKERQNYICKDCNKKFNNLIGTIFHHIHLTYRQIEETFNCTINLFFIKKIAKKNWHIN